MTDKKIIYVPVRHGEFHTEDLEPYRESNIVDFWILEKFFSEEEVTKLIMRLAKRMPPLVKEYIENVGGWGITIEYYEGEESHLKKAVDRQVETVISEVYDTGGDGDYYDCVPSYVEEFVLFCQQLEYLEPVQKLYDSLWDIDNAYYPPSDVDALLYPIFQINGIKLHTDHPKGD